MTTIRCLPTPTHSLTLGRLNAIRESSKGKSILERELLSRVHTVSLGCLTMIDASMHLVISVVKLPFAAVKLILDRVHQPLLSERWSVHEIRNHLHTSTQCITALFLDIPYILKDPTSATVCYVHRGIIQPVGSWQTLLDGLWKHRRAVLLVGASLAIAALILTTQPKPIPPSDLKTHPDFKADEPPFPPPDFKADEPMIIPSGTKANETLIPRVDTPIPPLNVTHLDIPPAVINTDWIKWYVGCSLIGISGVIVVLKKSRTSLPASTKESTVPTPPPSSASTTPVPKSGDHPTEFPNTSPDVPDAPDLDYKGSDLKTPEKVKPTVPHLKSPQAQRMLSETQGSRVRKISYQVKPLTMGGYAAQEMTSQIQARLIQRTQENQSELNKAHEELIALTTKEFQLLAQIDPLLSNPDGQSEQIRLLEKSLSENRVNLAKKKSEVVDLLYRDASTTKLEDLNMQEIADLVGRYHTQTAANIDKIRNMAISVKPKLVSAAPKPPLQSLESLQSKKDRLEQLQANANGNVKENRHKLHQIATSRLRIMQQLSNQNTPALQEELSESDKEKEKLEGELNNLTQAIARRQNQIVQLQQQIAKIQAEQPPSSAPVPVINTAEQSESS